MLETALILGGGRSLALPDDLSRGRARGAGTGGHGARLESTVRAAIEEALRASRGAIYGPRGAAGQLGLKPATLQSKMKKLGIRRQDFT